MSSREASLGSLREEKWKLGDQLDAATEKIDSLTTELEKLQTKHQDLKAKYRALQQEPSQITSGQDQSLEEQLKGVTAKCASLEADKEALASQYKSYRSEMRSGCVGFCNLLNEMANVDRNALEGLDVRFEDAQARAPPRHVDGGFGDDGDGAESTGFPGLPPRKTRWRMAGVRSQTMHEMADFPGEQNPRTPFPDEKSRSSRPPTPSPPTPSPLTDHGSPSTPKSPKESTLVRFKEDLDEACTIPFGPQPGKLPSPAPFLISEAKASEPAKSVLPKTVEPKEKPSSGVNPHAQPLVSRPGP
ncbi:MAG: hypothetical protein LQ350_003173 [Teloschistes chrysophthalmus]|nr:MAG: hypothetical protein LQ350_003173 [Niorma chrysophthalma]